MREISGRLVLFAFLSFCEPGHDKKLHVPVVNSDLGLCNYPNYWCILRLRHR